MSMMMIIIHQLKFSFRSFGYSKPMGTSDLFLILAQLKMKGLFYKRVKKEIDDETHNIKWNARQGLITK